MSFLKAAAHLVSLVAEIDRMMASRDRVPVEEPTSALPAGWMRLVVRYGDVDVHAVALRAGGIHLLEPHRRSLAERVDERIRG